MTIFKKRHSQPQISPLDPPPASTSSGPDNRRMSMQAPMPNGRPMGGGRDMEGVPGPDGFDSQGRGGSFRGAYPVPQPGVYYSGDQNARPNHQQQYRGQPQLQSQPSPAPELIAGPQYGTGSPVERVLSQKSRTGSEKSEKRKSGFFGFGRKDKDKDKDKERKEDERRESLQVVREQEAPQRRSFTVNREQEDSRMPIAQGQRFPSPLSQHSQTPAHDRVVSQPNPDFGGHPQQFPKSQSMGFNQLAQNPQYRNNMRQPQPPHLNAENRQYSGGSTGSDRLPKSSSTPLDRQIPGTPPTNGTSMSSSPAHDHPPPAASASAGNSPARNLDAQRSRATSNASGPVPGSAGVKQTEGLKEYAAIVDLIGAQPSKTYMSSPPELEMILARTSAGGQPKQGQPGSASNDWDAVWLQLSGISLSMWSMKETRAAAAKGEKVPPTYFNITDSSLELLAALPPPPHRPNSHPHLHVFSLNTAGSNRLLFSCPSERDFARWATSLRLAAWERARLEEIYTGHLIKSGGREPPRELVKGRMEGWVRVRVMGGTDWKRLWAVLSAPIAEGEDDKKTKRKSIFGFGKEEEPPIQEPNTGVNMASFYTEQRTPKNRATAPVLTITNVTQAYAVFPERLEVINSSNLMKVVGRIGGEMVTIEGRLRDSGWALIMPESEGGTPPAQHPLTNMLKWVTGFHDIFKLYGRPERYNWDERKPQSLFFAYPKGPDRNNLFLTTEEASKADHRAPHLPAIRAQFVNILRHKLEQPAPQQQQQQWPNEKSPPVPTKNSPQSQGDYRLPQMAFDKGNESPNYSEQSQPRSLSPITERTDIASRNNSQKTAKSIAFPERQVQSKQGSGSSKLSPTREQAHLESIPDADSSAASHGQGHPVVPIPMPVPAQAQQQSDMHRRDTTGTMQTADTMWSQSSGNHPVGSRSGVAAMTAATGVMTINDRTAPVASPTETANIHSPIPRKVSTGEIAPNKMDLHDEPAARYLMDMVDENPQAPPAQPVPPKNAEPERVRPTINTDISKSPPPLGRKPSGARAIPPKKSAEPRLMSVDDTNKDAQNGHTRQSTFEYEDASAYLAYAEEPSPIATTHNLGPVAGAAAAGAAAVLPKEEYAKISEHTEPSPPQEEPVAQKEVQAGPVEQSDPAPVVQSPVQGRTSAMSPDQPSNAALSPSQQRTVPDSPDEPLGNRRQGSMRVLPPVPQSAQQSQPEQQQQQQQRQQQQQQGQQAPAPQEPPRQASPLRQQPRQDYDRSSRRGSDAMTPSQYQQQRASQFEPPQPAYMDRPRSRSPGGNQMPPSAYQPPQAPFMDQPRSRSPGMPPQPQHRSSSYSLRQAAEQQQQQQYSAPTPTRPQPLTNQSRQTMWNANFASGHGMPEPTKSGKFVDLEEPQAQLTKAFAPHGLLQAGLQDKEERSAKKQEELAREMGSSLVNVPSKPPPPSAGLLGAVAQHEKERKGAGGIGATLTDREREKRLAEERQREMEKMQRQQMEQGGFNFQGGFNPYMGMPMMGMPQMGFNPYQSGYNPYAAQQAMFAAQMAYNNAMMAHMSTAGSQAGHGDGRNSPAGGSQYGGGTPNANNNDGNMSMYGGMMPWMMPGMGSPSPQMGQMGMPGMGMQGMGGMGMPSPYGMPGMPGQQGGQDYMGQQYTGKGSQAGTPSGGSQQQHQGAAN